MIEPVLEELFAQFGTQKHAVSDNCKALKSWVRKQLKC
jgi:hypothetical protein